MYRSHAVRECMVRVWHTLSAPQGVSTNVGIPATRGLSPARHNYHALLITSINAIQPHPSLP